MRTHTRTAQQQNRARIQARPMVARPVGTAPTEARRGQGRPTPLGSSDGNRPSGQGLLLSLSVPWPEMDLLAFLDQAAGAPRVYWESGREALAFAGYGAAAVLTASGPDRVSTIQQAASRLFARAIIGSEEVPPIAGPRLFGGFSFQATHQTQGVWSAFPAAYFVLPRYQLAEWEGRFWLTINHCLTGGEVPAQVNALLEAEIQALRQGHVGRDGAGLTHLSSGAPKATNGGGHTSEQGRLQMEDVVGYEQWAQMVTESTARIRRGALEKVVLARARRVTAPQPIDPLRALSHLKARYGECYRFLIEPQAGHAFYGATPELLAEVQGRRLRTVALAGSIRRGQSAEEDEALGQALLASRKERHEHGLVVEAVEQAVRPLTITLSVPDEPGLYRLSNIQHLQTIIEGTLAQPWGILPLVQALHPTPALGGTPRPTALDIIATAEPFQRGWYASPVGWLDHQQNGLFAVAIRSAVSVGQEACLFAGAGIVGDSLPQREWDETHLKFRPMLEALESATNL